MTRAQTQMRLFDESATRVERVSYAATRTEFARTIETSKEVQRSAIKSLVSAKDAHDAFDASWLRTKTWPKITGAGAKLRVADLFCGAGGLSLGAWEAARALGKHFEPVLAWDNDRDAIAVYQHNFAAEFASTDPVEGALNGTFGGPSTLLEKQLIARTGAIDLLLAGPPCQGHSDLNNHTRRDDPRNSLILDVVRFAELFAPRHVVIENVQGIRHDRSGNFQEAERRLRKLNYATSSFLLEASELGVAQKRRRCFLVGSRHAPPTIDSIRQSFSVEPRTLDWACGDLDANGEGVFDTSAEVSGENSRRMQYLIDNELFDLPNAERPDCHRLKEHAYTAVYGRLRGDVPAPTITTGFGSPGQGRYTHPREARTLTPHEAARLQFFPDFFAFPLAKRKQLQKLIGNAVPSKLAFPILVELLVND